MPHGELSPAAAAQAQSGAAISTARPAPRRRVSRRAPVDSRCLDPVACFQMADDWAKASNRAVSQFVPASRPDDLARSRCWHSHSAPASGPGRPTIGERLVAKSSAPAALLPAGPRRACAARSGLPRQGAAGVQASLEPESFGPRSSPACATPARCKHAAAPAGPRAPRPPCGGGN